MYFFLHKISIITVYTYTVIDAIYIIKAKSQTKER